MARGEWGLRERCTMYIVHDDDDDEGLGLWDEG